MRAFLESTSLGWELARGLTVAAAALVGGGLVVATFRPCPLTVAGNTFIFSGSVAAAVASAFLVRLRLDSWPASLRRGVIVLIVSAIALQFLFSSMFGAADRSRQERALAEMRRLAARLESGVKAEAGLDPWGHRYLISAVPDGGYSIVSLGECGEPDIQPSAAYVAQTTSRTTDDIVLVNGTFIRYPEGIQNQWIGEA